MNLHLLLQIFLFLTLTIFSQKTHNNLEENEKEIKVVFSKNSFHNIKLEDAHATAQILANHIKKLKNVKSNFKVEIVTGDKEIIESCNNGFDMILPVSYTHLRAHETVLDLVCRLLLEKKQKNRSEQIIYHHVYDITHK